MNRKEIIGQLEDLLYNFKNFESIETTDDDVVALEFAINELKGTAQEVPVQEQSIFKAQGKCNQPCILFLKTYED
ncbi:MAG: hypothetical protein E6936_02185 [Clostridium perfringens]|nr:hypothetical protein [Clostridium perfringens]MDU2320638.1 hypothetical protein [Clostridium perfringens]